jgi:hypothetical protein
MKTAIQHESYVRLHSRKSEKNFFCRTCVTTDARGAARLHFLCSIEPRRESDAWATNPYQMASLLLMNRKESHFDYLQHSDAALALLDYA